jgi:hypothetical protein
MVSYQLSGGMMDEAGGIADNCMYHLEVDGGSLSVVAYR